MIVSKPQSPSCLCWAPSPALVLQVYATGSSCLYSKLLYPLSHPNLFFKLFNFFLDYLFSVSEYLAYTYICTSCVWYLQGTWWLTSPLPPHLPSSFVISFSALTSWFPCSQSPFKCISGTYIFECVHQVMVWTVFLNVDLKHLQALFNFWVSICSANWDKTPVTLPARCRLQEVQAHCPLLTYVSP